MWVYQYLPNPSEKYRIDSAARGVGSFTPIAVGSDYHENGVGFGAEAIMIVGLSVTTQTP